MCAILLVGWGEGVATLGRARALAAIGGRGATTLITALVSVGVIAITGVVSALRRPRARARAPVRTPAQARIFLVSWHGVSLRLSAHSSPLAVHTWTRLKSKTLLGGKSPRLCERILDADRPRADGLDCAQVEAARAGGLREAEARHLGRRCRGHCAWVASREAWGRRLVGRRLLRCLRRGGRCPSGSFCNRQRAPGEAGIGVGVDLPRAARMAFRSGGGAAMASCAGAKQQSGGEWIANT
jgi:hypothetical protein